MRAVAPNDVGDIQVGKGCIGGGPCYTLNGSFTTTTGQKPRTGSSSAGKPSSSTPATDNG